MTRVRPARRSAYTLIELLIVVGILGLATALLVPQIVDRDSMAAQAAVRRVIADITFAQSDALAHQEMRRVHFFSDGRGYCLVRIDQGDLAAAFDEATADYIFDPLAESAELGRYIVDFSQERRFDGITIISTDIDGVGGPNLNFDTLGGTVMAGNSPGVGGDIVIGSADVQYQITIAPFTGKLTVTQL
ncbi:MAG: pilus assembly FimT family protein [Planctomycetota bacterium]|jgi:prepilin-type N-terminal cleavage/methylation domain-containing protein